MKAKLKAFSSLIRLKYWWYSKIPMYLALGLMLGIRNYSFYRNLMDLLLLFTWLFGGSAFGYFLNDCFDIEQDKAVGKPNIAGSLTERKRLYLILTFAGIAILPWILSSRIDLFALAVLQIGIFLAYSIRPARLKDRLYAGIAADSIYAYIIPIVLIFLLYHKNPWSHDDLWPTGIPLIIWAIAAGSRAILYHHLSDRKTDAVVAIGNVVNKFGAKVNIGLLNIMLVLELSSFCLVYLQKPFEEVKAAVLIIYIIFSFVSINREGIRISVISRIKYGKIALYNFYEKWLLFIVSILAVAADWRYIGVLAGFILLFMVKTVMVRPYYILATFYYKIVVGIYINVILRIYYLIRYKLIVPAFYILVFNIIRPVASYIVNHIIYYYRIWVLRLSDKDARNLTTEIPFRNLFKIRAPLAKEVQEKPSFNIRKHNSEVEFLEGPLTEANKKVNALWIGDRLSRIELLTIRSFIEMGHEFHLWVYEPILTELPFGTITEDANKIIDKSKIFRYKYANHFGHGKGSVSGFSDIFRYKLLYEKGGWWTDMDMTCLRPLNVVSPYFFRSHHELFLVGNIMKVPKGSELMLSCYTEASVVIDENNRDWHKPIEILNKYVDHLHLDEYVISGYSNEDKWDEVKLYAKGSNTIPEKYMVLHWMNEEWRSRKIDKDDLRLKSTLAKEMIKYKILCMPQSRGEIWRNEMRHRLYLPVFEFYQE